MCGIVGYVGSREAVPILLDGLKRLEYRGYDSAGIAVLNSHGTKILRSQGKLFRLIEKVGPVGPRGTTGIGHTRWATHGRPSERNAHPHHVGRVTLVHNGIIENYQSLKEGLPRKGAELKSETDTEIVCHLIQQNLDRELPFLESLRKSLRAIEGTYALVMIDEKSPDRLYLAKKGSPLVIGVGEGDHFIASDIPALLPYTKKVLFLEDNEIAVVDPKEVVIYNGGGKPIPRDCREISWTTEMAEKGGFKHFMFKEIMEQPRVIADTLMGRLSRDKGRVELSEIAPFFKGKKFPFFNRFYMVACGTSWHAALAGKYFMEAIAKIPVAVDTASEFRYREPFIDKKTLLLVISQSGETADTLACVQEARKRGAVVFSICNAIDSSIPRHSHATLYTRAGPEIGVASTKAFTTQLLLLLLLALHFGRLNRKLDSTYIKKAVRQLVHLPLLMEKVLERRNEILKIAHEFYTRRDVYFIARGVHFPIALEGALKLKEISYIHAEGHSAGEMKHGPIALLEPATLVVALAPQDRVCVKMISNIEEVRARGATVMVVSTEGDERFTGGPDPVIPVPPTEWYVTPLLVSLPLQLLAYYIADLKGTDIDQPRNLAKSVTVE